MEPLLSMELQNHFFNISRSKELALYCFSGRWKTGIDIEHQSGVKDIFRFSRRYFTRKENELLLKAESRELLVLFYRIWTRKEACLKAPGWGLTKPLNYLDVDPESDSPVISTGGSGFGELTLAVSDIKTESGYSASVAAIITDRKPHYAGWFYSPYINK
jgi:4'-phosphopantetheinyl transferase